MIINFHGVDGHACNTNYRLLKSRYICERIYSPQLDYRNTSLTNILESLRKEINSLIQTKEKINFVVGNSFGGFIASIIAHEYNRPSILTNPCLRPDIAIDNVVPGYMAINHDEVMNQIHCITSSENSFCSAHIIVGDADEVLNTSDMLHGVHPQSIEVISGTHRLSGEEFNKTFLRMCDSIEASN